LVPVGRTQVEYDLGTFGDLDALHFSVASRPAVDLEQRRLPSKRFLDHLGNQ
jgi:hypothetical protein